MRRNLLSSLAAAFLCLPALAQQNVVDEVIWVVGDDPILLSDVEETRISAEMRGTPFENPYCTIPEQLAIQKLFLHQAELDSVQVDESNINSAVDEEINVYLQNLGSKENIEALARKPFAQFRSDLKKRQREGYMVNDVQRKITSDIKVTPAEVREFYKDVPADSLPFVPTQVEVQIITHVPEVTRAEVERIETQLRDYARRVNEKESDFSTLAMLYSQDGSARNGGELGFHGRNEWVPEFSNVAFSMTDPQKVSKIVRTEFGYHIIQFIERRGDRINVRHILLKPEISQSEITAGLLRLDSIADDIRHGLFTFDAAAAALSDDKDTRNNRGIMVNTDQESGALTSRFEMKDLPQDVAKVVDTLKVGEISKAFTMVNSKGQEVCAVVCLKNRIEGHRASMTEDFQILKNEVFAQRSEEKIKEWIRNKQKTTYVRINNDWKNCNFEYPGWIKQ